MIGDAVTQELAEHSAPANAVAFLGDNLTGVKARQMPVSRGAPHVLQDKAVRVLFVEVLLFDFGLPLVEQSHDVEKGDSL